MPTASRLGLQAAYRRKTAANFIDLFLDANEGPGTEASLRTAMLSDLDMSWNLQRYPDARELEQQLARYCDVPEEQVLVTAGGDDALLRICLAYLNPGDEMLLAEPSFEMLARYAQLAGAELRRIPENSNAGNSTATGRFPIEAMLQAIDPDRPPKIIAVVSPNNPTGSIATSQDLERLSSKAPGALLLVDLAYTEFAELDLTRTALELPRVFCVRTFSKAWGLAGARVGWVLAQAALLEPLRISGNPYAVASPSLNFANSALAWGQSNLQSTVDQVRGERERLGQLLSELGLNPRPSQANFVLFDCQDTSQANFLQQALASLGIAVRRFDKPASLSKSLRITCPANEAQFERLCRALKTCLRPTALLFDMDGVLVDVSKSYRRAIQLTAQSFGVEASPADIDEIKARGNANCDWRLTQELLAKQGLQLDLATVTKRFESFYQGTGERSGLWLEETCLVQKSLLEDLGQRFQLAVVTGRPRKDAQRFLESQGLADCFDCLVAREGAPLKPDPAPVRRALAQLGVESAWMLGDTPDDARAARGATVLPIGVLAPAPNQQALVRATDSLEQAGVACVLNNVSDLAALALSTKRVALQ